MELTPRLPSPGGTTHRALLPEPRSRVPGRRAARPRSPRPRLSPPPPALPAGLETGGGGVCLASRDGPRWQSIPPPRPGTLPPRDPLRLPVRRPPRPNPARGLPAPSRRPPGTLTVLGEDIEAGLRGAPRQVPPAAGGPGRTAAPAPAGLRLLKPGSLPDAAHLLPHPGARQLPRPRRPPVTFLLGSGLGLLGLLRPPCQSWPRPWGAGWPAAPHPHSSRCLSATHRPSFPLLLPRLRVPSAAAAAIFKPPSSGKAWSRASPAPTPSQSPPLLRGRASRRPRPLRRPHPLRRPRPRWEPR